MRGLGIGGNPSRIQQVEKGTRKETHTEQLWESETVLGSPSYVGQYVGPPVARAIQEASVFSLKRGRRPPSSTPSV